MRDIVRPAFVGFTRKLEGPTSWMYLDRLGIPTTGYGNALFSTAAAVALQWRRPDGSLASRDEIIAEYSSVQNMKGKRNARGELWTDAGGGHFAQLTRLRLDAEAVMALVHSTMTRYDAALAHRYPDWAEWPACAQMACLSLAWACGSNYDFPKMDRSLADRDFATAALEIEMTKASNPGNNLEDRNLANRILMLNAARVQAFHLDPDMLDWTHVLGVVDAPTQPEFDIPRITTSMLPPPLDTFPHANPVHIEDTRDSAASAPTIYPRMLDDDPDDAA